MKKNILYIALLGMMSLMTVSCDSELDIEKHGNMGSMDTYYTTDDNVMTGTASLYLEVKSAYYNWLFVKNLLSDDVWCGGGQRGDNGEMEKLNEYSFDSNHGMVENLYTSVTSCSHASGSNPRDATPPGRGHRAWHRFAL